MAEQRTADNSGGDAQRRADAVAALQGPDSADGASAKSPDGPSQSAGETPNETDATPRPAADDTQAALDAMASSPSGAGDGSATGFAAILAHGPGPEPDLPAKPPKGNYNSALPKPKPQERQSDPIGFAARPNRYSEDIREAREIRAPGTYTPPTPRAKRAKRAPDSYKILIPVMVTMGSLLFLIGLWAVAVAAHMHVPLAPARYSSHYNFYMGLDKILIVGLPIAVMLYVLAYFMARVLRRYDQSESEGGAANPPVRGY